MLKLSSMNYTVWGSPSMTIQDNDVTICVLLDAEDKIELEALAVRLFEKRQSKIVAAVAAMEPRLMAPPVEAEIEDV